MPVIPVKKLSIGAKLAEDVHTPLGGLLFTKGTLISEKEMELLDVFQVREVDVEEMDSSRTEEKTETEKPKPNAGTQKQHDFQALFEKATASLKALMLPVQGGQQNIPVMEVRVAITPVLQQVHEQPNLLLTLQNLSRIDSYPHEHAIAVGLLSYTIAKWLKVPEKEWMQIALAGTLLDVGKTRIDRKILQKPGKLTAEEFEEIKKHTVYGYQLLKASPGLNEGVALAALQHHEREDGSGYPLGLKGNKLHLYSKITAVADVYHAMSSERVYKKGLSPYLVAEQLIQDSFGKLDPTIVHTFVRGITQFSVGTAVELSDGTFGKIIFTDRNHPTRPMVEANGRIINLAEARHLSIVKVI
ncbi:HD-GYP domain-containing protein [Brevibacillus sp. SYP-B805]|uniref:HD-GYP domain-containing protein n=1 Tax=Brevibacillus sp. SYP-B805 TaxID=1578199 RepID=UPI0013ED15D1|nr:HD-GYP domain-containing protein [Brevibacillus sp. SYP-B805]NGQ96543.1 HD-GYP domain-containing protein [Brevibacillus sp. SYP-B805]